MVIVAPRRILGGKDLNTRQTPFQSVKPMQGHAAAGGGGGGDVWSPPFTKPTHRRTSRRQSVGVRISPVKDVPAVQTVSADVEDIEYMPPTAAGSSTPKYIYVNTTVDIPYEPLDYEMDWEEYGNARQDISSYFLKLDEFGKSEMDYFVETKMDFGKDQELPICPPPPAPKHIKAAQPRLRSTVTKKWAPTKPVRPIARPVKGLRQTRGVIVPKQKFVRDEMKAEIAQLEREELELCKDDDFGMTFDLEL